MLYGNIKNYRINSCKITKQPTEDKYSCAPIKIVGFLPREAGEGIMLPYDITLLTGSDFDKHQCWSKIVLIAGKSKQSL